MASSVSSNGGGSNVMIRSKADSIVAGGHANSMDERNTTVVGTTMMGTTATATGLAAGPERGAGTTADDSAISFSEEEEDDVDEEDEEDDEEEDDSGSIMADHQPESAAAAAAAAFNAAAAAAFQRQLLANFPLFHSTAAADGSTKLDNDPSNASAMDAQSASGNPFETYIAAAAAAAAAAANAEALYRHQQQMTALTGGCRSEKRSAAHDSGTDDNDTSVSGKGAGSVGASAGIAPQQPSNKRRKQSKPVRISSDAGNEDNAAVTAFLAAQTAAAAAAAAALFHQNPNASSEEEEEGSLQTSNGRRISSSHPQMMEWTPSRDANNAGSNESEQEEGQIIRSSSDNSPGQAMFDQQLANRLLMAGNSSASARNLAEFLAASSGKGGGSFPLFPPSAYGGNWNQQQQMMMSMMAMNRSAMDDGEVSRSSSHSSGSPHGASDAAKKNHNNDGGGGGERESGERSNSESPFAFRNAPKYGGAAGGGFFPSSSSASSFGPAPHPFLFPFLSSASGNSPSANQPMRGASGMGGSPSVGGIRIFNHEAYCELCNKEFCNKYFLKTHKANKHGIYTDNIPATSGGPPTTTSSTTPTSSSSGSGAPSQQPFSVSSSFGPPLSLTVGAMTYPMHPPSTELAATEPSVTYSPIMTTSPSKLIYPTTATTSSSSMIVTTPGMNPSALMDFFPLWSSPSSTTTAPVVTTVNNTMTPAPLLPSVATMKQHLPGGIVNPEAYCDLCQKEFCNKYFLKRHKAKMHGIVPPDGSGVAASSASASGTAASIAPTGSALPAAVSSSGSSHKRSKSHPAKASSVGAAVDLIKIPQTLPVVASSPAASLANALPVANPVVESADHFMTGVDRETESRHSPLSTTTPFNLLMNNSVAGVGGINNETGGGSVGVGSVGSAKLDLSNGSGHRGGDNSLSLLKIPTPSLSTMFSSPPSMQMIHDGPSHPARHHSKTPSSSSSAASGGGATGAVPSGPQQMFTPERLRQMGVINTEAFCEICCKEFCNKYFLRTHKYKKHGIGSMPEQPQQQQQSQSGGGGGGMPESSSSSGMIRQHYNNNNNNKNNSPGSKQQQPEQSTEQKMPLNLATPPASAGSQQTADGGMPLTCDLCQRPFQSAYLLHMHRTYFHNQPPMNADDSGATDLENPSDDNRSDNGDEDETRPSTNNSPPPLSNIKSEPDVVVVQSASEDADINNSGVTISADLQKLQSMIMELNGSSSSAAAAAAVASLTEGDAALRRRCWIEGGKSVSAHNPPSNNGETANHFISASGGGIVKIVQPGETGSMEASVNPASSPSTVCHLCGNKDFFTSYFLQMHMQNYHGIVTSGSNGNDPSAAAMEAAVAAAASQLGLDRLLDFGPSSANNGQSGGGGGGLKRSGRSSSSASPAANRSFCQICNKELCNKYFMKTHMLKMHGIHLEASGGGAQIGGVQCDICHKELCSKYFLKVHKQNTHGIGFTDHEMLPNGQMLKEPSSHQGVMDLSFHQHQQMDVSPAKSTTSTTECCPLCPKRFKSTKALKAHLSHDHSATSGSSGSTTSTCCYICNQQFGDVVALQVHLIKSHASHLMDHQTPPPQPPPVVNTSSAPPTEQQSVGQGCVSSSSSPSSKTTLPPFQCSFCDFATGSLPYLFAHERTHHHPMDPPATTTASPVTQSPPANQQKIQCPLCGQQLPLEQFQTHLMAHQLPINFLHTLMPPSAASAGPSHADEEEDDMVRSYQQQQQDIQQGQRKKQRRRRRYRCSVCSRKFATRQLCLTHILQRHPPSIRSGGGNNGMTKSGGISSPTSPVSCLVQQQQRPLTCPRCGYATRQPQLLRLHLRTQQCIPVVARNPDLQQLPPYLAVPTSTASNASAQSRAVNNNGLLQVQGQHAHRQDFVLQAFLLTQPDADNKNKNNKRSSKSNEEQQNGHHDDPEDPAAEIKREHEHNGRPHGQDDDQQQQQQQRASSSGDNVDGEEEGQNQSCNFIPSLILLPVNRRIANPLSLTFSLTPA